MEKEPTPRILGFPTPPEFWLEDVRGIKQSKTRKTWLDRAPSLFRLGRAMALWYSRTSGLASRQVVVGCAADVASGSLLFSCDGTWSSATFTGVQCAGGLGSRKKQNRRRVRCMASQCSPNQSDVAYVVVFGADSPNLQLQKEPFFP